MTNTTEPTKEQVAEWAIQSGMVLLFDHFKGQYRPKQFAQLARFADICMAHQREVDAKVCEEVQRQQDKDNGAADTGGAAVCAAAIRRV